MQKKAMFGFVLLALVFVSACQSERVQPAVDSSQDADEESLVHDVDDTIVEEIEADLEEDVSLEDDMIDEAVEEPLEEEIPEEEPEPVVSDVLNVRMKEGDVVDYKSHSIKMIDILVGQTIELQIDGDKVLMYETGSSELKGLDTRITYVNVLDYNKDNAVNMRFEPFDLKSGEFLLNKGDTATIGNYKVRLSDVRFDDRLREGYVYVDTPSEVISVVRLLEGETGKVGNATVTAVETFYQYRQYAILKIAV